MTEIADEVGHLVFLTKQPKYASYVELKVD